MWIKYEIRSTITGNVLADSLDYERAQQIARRFSYVEIVAVDI